MLSSRCSIASLLLALAAFCVPAASETTAFVGVNVIPMDAAGTLTDQTVIVEDGRIAAVGPRASTPVPDGASRIDGAGKYLIPGLTDVHVHIPTQGIMEALTGSDAALQPIENMLYLYVAAGVTTVRVMSGAPVFLEVRDAIARGEVLGPRLIVCTPMFDGPRPVWPAPLSRSISSAEEARVARSARPRSAQSERSSRARWISRALALAAISTLWLTPRPAWLPWRPVCLPCLSYHRAVQEQTW